MKDRPRSFLASVRVEDPEVFDYVLELHRYLWRFIRCHRPGAGGLLHLILDGVVDEAEDKAGYR